ncbi:MAG: polymerase subunit sigma-70 [Nitrospira sp.]|jgi:RNA polymerase sigma-70 factor (ECF subfamily)|nr:polymerase subunit sigma-70 [Nitrospira sp.]
MDESDQTDLVLELESHVSDLYRLLSRLLTEPSDVSDVIQELWLRVLTLRSTHFIHHPRAFLFRMTKNLAVDRLRRRSAHLKGHAELEEVSDRLSVSPNQEATLQARQELTLLHHAINELPPKCRQVFVLHKLKNWSHEEIAQHMGISRNMVEKHVMKGLSFCRKRLDAAT